MLDSSVYLSSFGWKGKGNGLRHGSASRPLVIPQKRTLAGLGKDRDEAFPFWDHLFTAAAKSIQIKLSGDKPVIENDSFPQSNLARTTTGILSGRRPVVGTPATSGTTTPSDPSSQHSIPRISLMATAKRESARKNLYARFFRGSVLEPDAAHDFLSQAPMTGEAQTRDTTPEQQKDENENKKKSKVKKKRKRDDIELAPIEWQGEDGGNTRHPLDDGLKLKAEGNEKGHIMKKMVEMTEEKRKRKAAKTERSESKDERRKRKKERRLAKRRPQFDEI